MCVKKYISDNIKLLMARKNIKAWSELAKQCGLTVPAMQRLINQQTESPGVNSLKAIADYFEISIDKLISENLHSRENGDSRTKTETYVPLFDDFSINKWLRLQNSIEVKSSDNTIGVDIPTSKNTFAYKILDANLDSIMPDNSILIVDAERKIQNKDYVLLKYSGFDKIIIRQILTDGIDKYTVPIMSTYNNVPHEKMSLDTVIVGVIIKISIYYR